MTLMQFAHGGSGGAAEARLREILDREVERIRAEAADQLAEQCRLLAALSMSVATAEAARERRMEALARELREQAARTGPAPPRPLDIPRAPDTSDPSVTDLWSARDRRT
jgi:hypothetical protein